jgi:hypothetical protein
MAADIQDFTQAVNIIGGSVSITGIATVSISGTPSVSITGTANVAVVGTANVAITSGSVSITGTPSINILSQSVILQQSRVSAGGAAFSVAAHPFAGAIAAGGTLSLMSASIAGGIQVYALHLVLDIGYTAGSADLTLEHGVGNVVIDHFSTALAFDDLIDYEGMVVPNLADIHLHNNAAQSVTVRGVLIAVDKGSG